MQDVGVSLYAISYDDPEALADFAAAHDIEFPLLADPNSDVIKAFGILNTLVPEEEAEFHGMPFPGAYVTNGEGVITAKFFENSLAFRPGPEQLLRAATGERFESGPAAEPVEEVKVSVYLEGPNIAPGLTRELVVELVVPEGQHLYGEPVGDGLVATSVEFDPNDNLIVFDAVRPPTSVHELPTGERLNIYEGVVQLRVPITARGGLELDRNSDGSDSRFGELAVSGTVRFQTCDDVACSLPQSTRFEVAVSIQAMIVGDFGRDTPRTMPMNGMQHMQRLFARRER